MIDALVAFLRERLDDDERTARAATPGPWRYNPDKQWLPEPDEARRCMLAVLGARGEEYVAAGQLDAPICVAGTGPADDPQSMADAAHIARHNPDRALQHVEATRAILAQYVAVCDEVRDPKSADHYAHARSRQFQLEQVLPLLALSYAAHPDYRAEWAS